MMAPVSPLLTDLYEIRFVIIRIFFVLVASISFDNWEVLGTGVDLSYFGEIYFETKNLEKVSLLFSPKFLTTFFLVIDNFHSKCNPFSLYCCLCFCFLSCL